MKFVNLRKRIFVKKSKTWKKMVALVAFSGVLVFSTSLPVFASGGDVISQGLGQFKDIVLAFVSSIGIILCAWGIGEWGISTSSQDGTTQASALKRIGGGIVMALAPQILSVIV